MLFQSYGFIFAFLPLVVVICQLLRSPYVDRHWRAYFLVLASVFFYTYLSPSSLPFLFFSCAVNFFLGNRIQKFRTNNAHLSRWLVGLGITFNVIVLIALKYSNELGWSGIEGGYFPLGASFITFIQIVYLLETFNGSLRQLKPYEYLQSTMFFGFVTSGPVVNPRELVAQYDSKESSRRLDTEHLLAGVALFSIGLFKKLVLADSLAPYSSVIFDAASQGQTLLIGDAWIGSAAYMLQLYFDFSGYSDMAIAIGFLVGMRLPLNFNSPFKATSAMDYWQRWHMTLTRFITNYLYLPFAVRLTRIVYDQSINSETVRFLLTIATPTLLAFIVAGVWHGNGWPFFAYGVYWGIALSVFQAWRRFGPGEMPKFMACGLTLLTALGSLVIFKSSSLASAGIIFSSAFIGNSEGAYLLPPGLWLSVISLFIAVLVLPNSQQILSRYQISSDEVDKPTWGFLFINWSASAKGAVFLGITLVAALLMGGGPTQFLYYKF